MQKIDIGFQYDCCGVTNYTDFDKLSNETGWDRKINVDGEPYTMVTPLACCKSAGSYPEFEPLQDNCTYEPSDENNNWDKVMEDFKHILYSSFRKKISCVLQFVTQLFQSLAMWFYIYWKSACLCFKDLKKKFCVLGLLGGCAW